MTYIKEKFYLNKTVSQPANQIISDSYVEITGSNGYVNPKSSTSKIVYKFSFYLSQPSGETKFFLHAKLQKSNDGFTSNIVDIPGANYNIANDTISIVDSLYKVTTILFIVDSFTEPHNIRLVFRSYDTNAKAWSHKNRYFDGTVSPTDKFYNTTLVIFEV